MKKLFIKKIRWDCGKLLIRLRAEMILEGFIKAPQKNHKSSA